MLNIRELGTRKTILAVILFVFFLAIYVFTAAPGVYDGDSGEITAAVHNLGLAHTTGFPLYILTAKLFTYIVPVSDVAYRLNLFSAFLTALAIAFVFLMLVELKFSATSAFISSLTLGFGSTIWSHAGAARVYPLILLISSVLFLIFAKWLNRIRIFLMEVLDIPIPAEHIDIDNAYARHRAG